MESPLTTDAPEQVTREHAALRRVATFVARQPQPEEVFALVTREAGMLLGARITGLLRVDSPETAVIVAGWSQDEATLPIGSRGPLDGRGLMGRIIRTRGPVRLEDFDEAGPAVAAQMRRIGVTSAVAGPIIIGERIWGALSAAWPHGVPMPDGAERRIAEFAELVSYAIDNAQSREELAASRVRLVEASDEQRRRVVRDLHDGAQQRLVQAVITLQLAHSQESPSPELVREALEETRAAVDELRQLAHGIHPTLLTTRGLAAAVESLADRAPVPVELDMPDLRHPPSVESAAYFVAAETLTNIAKYASASIVRVRASSTPDELVIEVEDDGVGGATVAPGGGLAGLQDRVAALNGTLMLDSPRGGGTRIRAEIPFPPPSSTDAADAADAGQ